MLRLIIDGGLSCVRVWQLRTVCVSLFHVNDTGSTGSRGCTVTVVMGEVGGGSNPMAMKDAHRRFAACLFGGAEYRLETSDPRVGILKPKQEVRGTGG